MEAGATLYVCRELQCCGTVTLCVVVQLQCKSRSTVVLSAGKSQFIPALPESLAQ